MSWIWTAFLPHPPLLIPQVGGDRRTAISTTINGLQSAIKEISTGKNGKKVIPSKILVFSPHAPYVPGNMVFNNATTCSGTFGRFGADTVEVSFSADIDTLNNLRKHLISNDVPLAQGTKENITADHGSLVPLYFLQEHWGELPEIYVANIAGLTLQQAYDLGVALAEYNDGYDWGLLGSGDLSHRLTHSSPSGYHSVGEVFDRAVVNAFTAGTPDALFAFSEEEIADAGECGLRTALSLLGFCKEPLQVHSYEGPYGVGYCTATKNFVSSIDATSKKDSPAKETLVSSVFPALARQAITAHLNGEPAPTRSHNFSAEDKEILLSSKACFVTIKTQEDALRGCIGTILPVRGSLYEEILANAVAAATSDSRFPAMKKEELATAKISVDLLSTPVKVQDISELDPAVYGVIVTKGHRRGVLLPNLEGVDTVEKQISIAVSKGGINSLQNISVARFTVERFLE